MHESIERKKLMNQIELIRVEALYPHPKNPRRSVGDVTELADSIRRDGIMQNLTAVRGGEGVPAGGEGYTVIIGHRRLAAAKEAGLTELPVKVVEMDETKQLSTMIAENMQRTDLTVTEQAEGIQMMLDLGESAESVSEMTGLSLSTVYKRAKLACFDKSALRDAEARGGTILEYLEAAKIEDEKARNKLLEKAGTENFKFAMQKALRDQEVRKRKPRAVAELNRIAAKNKTKTDLRFRNGYSTVKCVYIYEWEPGAFKEQKLKKGEELFWEEGYGDSLYLIKKELKSKAPKKDPKEALAEERRKQLAAAGELAYRCRADFIANFTASKKYADVIGEWLLESAYRYTQEGWDGDYNREFIQQLVGNDKCRYSTVKRCLDVYMVGHPSTWQAVAAYCLSGDKKGQGYCYMNWGTKMPEHHNNEALDRVYGWLGKLGYEMSDEEKQLRDGSHPLFGEGASE